MMYGADFFEGRTPTLDTDDQDIALAERRYIAPGYKPLYSESGYLVKLLKVESVEAFPSASLYYTHSGKRRIFTEADRSWLADGSFSIRMRKAQDTSAYPPSGQAPAPTVPSIVSAQTAPAPNAAPTVPSMAFTNSVADKPQAETDFSDDTASITTAHHH